jgi:hypothetical protein
MVIAEPRELVLLIAVLYFSATGLSRIGRPQRVTTRWRRLSSGHRIKEELVPMAWLVMLCGVLRLLFACLCLALWIWLR